MCLGLSLACSLCGFGLLINCGPEPVAGVSVKYGNRLEEICVHNDRSQKFLSESLHPK